MSPYRFNTTPIRMRTRNGKVEVICSMGSIEVPCSENDDPIGQFVATTSTTIPPMDITSTTTTTTLPMPVQTGTQNRLIQCIIFVSLISSIAASNMNSLVLQQFAYIILIALLVIITVFILSAVSALALFMCKSFRRKQHSSSAHHRWEQVNNTLESNERMKDIENKANIINHCKNYNIVQHKAHDIEVQSVPLYYECAYLEPWSSHDLLKTKAHSTVFSSTQMSLPPPLPPPPPPPPAPPLSTLPPLKSFLPGLYSRQSHKNTEYSQHRRSLLLPHNTLV
ncbi:unnamed protein product [Adineta ricciae]|uniref:Uncharacterized protein n=1 Tax=Adineta ricciae TaxID=249248 RepID=A0A815S4C8_ADIRI|nr:unnamed protein product [Adineta ricciae]CAF1485259.1 unnamed protein product [Adineta ricciae]